MKRAFSAKRVPRKIGSDDEQDAATDNSGSAQVRVQRPALKGKRLSHVARISAPASDDDEGETDSGVVTPKKSSLSRIALQRSAGQRSSFLANELPRSNADDRPTYSAADLQALKDSTPSTPQQVDTQDAPLSRAVDVRDKFGSSLTQYEHQQGTAIPTATEIAEKKARRARLALESQADEYISLDPDDPGWQEDDDGNVIRDMNGRLVLREKDKYKIQESRLVRDDEDVMEGFDEYTGDTGNRIDMGISARPQDESIRRNNISAQIAEAEEGSDSEIDEEEKMRNAAFERAQTRHGAYGSNADGKQDKYAELRPKTPPNMVPLPTMDAVMRRLRATLLDMENRKRAKQADLERLTAEKFRLRDEEVRVQAQLQEVAEKFRQLKMEKGYLPKEQDSNVTNEVEALQPQVDTIMTKGEEDEKDEEMDRPGLGLGASTAGLGMNNA